MNRLIRIALPSFLAATLFLFPGCKGVRYGISSALRSGTDYEALESARTEAARAGSSPVAAGADAPAAYWTQYRGPYGTGVYDEQPLALDWPDGGPPELWRVAVGPAYSSAVVASGLVVTMEQRREREAVIALSLETGALVWEDSWPARFHEAMSKEGPRATPAVKGDAVVSLGATGELRCLDLRTGELRWRHDLLDGGARGNLYFGLSASPRIRGDLVIAQGVDSVAAFDLQTGEPRWRALSEVMAYATPQLGELHGAPVAVVTTAERIVGLDIDSGGELWSFPWRVSDGLSCTQPLIIDEDRVLVSAGYGQGSQLVELSGRTDPSPTVVWQSNRFRTRFNEAVLVGDFAYGLDEGLLACLDVTDGTLTWKRRGFGYGQLLLVGDTLLVLTEEGEIKAVRAHPEAPTELGSFQALDGFVTLAVPALAHGRLILRNEREMVCYDLRPRLRPS